MAHYFSRYKFQGDYVLRNIFAKKLRIALSQFPDYTIVPIPISQNDYQNAVLIKWKDFWMLQIFPISPFLESMKAKNNHLKIVQRD